ncbi:Disease resistance protein (CC-NBS-LRR class) family [Abeliophyllum distichum]|uniref:Disease resistance protein (CC-NBS-LRR class) family n=1 Tax=Abeliophyllum distichum TaxID=126358 RepID=A0ABD1RWE9_9LAMI
MAYAALLSLKHLLEHTLDHDYQYLILDEKQQIETLLQRLCFLQDYLDHSLQKSSETIDFLESQIRDAAYEAEDIIESHITDRVHEQIASKMSDSFTPFCHNLKEVIEEIDSIKKRVEKVKDENDVQDLQTRTGPSPDSLKQPASSRGMSSMVGLDDQIMKIKEWLSGVLSNLETLSVVGMGGIGKTTLTRKVYDDGFSVYHFHIRAWVTVSQEYNERELLLELLDFMKKPTDELRKKSFEQLAEYLYKTLKGTRYLIVLDDMWDTKVWDKVKRSFPNDKNGSRILVTTRLENVGGYANSSSTPHHMRFLNEGESWNLFCENVFGKDGCPTELKQIGKKIFQNCQGLPLAIVVIAGLLSKATKTQHYWTYIGENLSSVIASNDDNYSKILSLSYKHLPHHLKGCFLYIGIFLEDYTILVSKLVKLWVAGRLLKPVRSKSLEDVAREYLLELVDRNLILVHEKSSIGKIKSCRIHDLLRDFCVREARRKKFFHVNNMGLCGISEGTKVRRLSIHSCRKLNDLDNSLQNMRPRSVLNFDWEEYHQSDKLINSKLLSVFDTTYTRINEFPVNLRYFACMLHFTRSFPASLRNLQTLICSNEILKILEIWEMRQLRHVKIWKIILPDPPSAETEGINSIIVLDNLQTLCNVVNFRFTEEVLQRILKLKKLGISFGSEDVLEVGYYCLNNCARLVKLELLKLKNLGRSQFFYEQSFRNITFPISLKKLSLKNCFVPWEDMTIVGSLPNLQVLKYLGRSFVGLEWEPNEGEFLQLKYLRLRDIYFENWIANNIHFPSLESLVIDECDYLKEIPSGIVEIPTLESIEVFDCSDSVVTSTKQIQEEQHSLGNDYLQVRIVNRGGRRTWRHLESTHARILRIIEK